MKKPLLLSAILMLLIGTLMAQQPTGALTIFSEDGDKFFLILNGERQNNVAQTNIRVEDLPQPYYNTKIIFEDQTLGEISKNLMLTSGGEATLMDVTYKIKKDKNNGKMNVRYFSAIPVQQGFIAPANVYVMHYGVPATAVAVVPAGGTVSRTTTTTTTTGGVPAGGMNVNMGGMGVNMNVAVTDPNMTSTTQTTTTHTTTTSTGSTMMMENNSAPVVEGCAGTYCMNPGNFSSALATIKNQGFDETKLSTAKQIAGSNCLDANQVAAICKEFGFEETKLAFAKFAYKHCTEPNNYFKINNVFGFSTSVDDLNKYIQSKQ